MKFSSSLAMAVLTAVFASGLVTTPALAASDNKSVGPLGCQPYGPGTTVSELTYNQNGITNPGSTIEYVICQIPGDAESGWSSTPGSSANLYVWFRAGSIPGRVACTAYTGSTAVSSGATYSSSVNPTTLGAGARGHYTIQLAEASGAYSVAPPTSVLCMITPKATLGTLYVEELTATNTP